MSTFQNFTYRLRRIGDGHFGFYLFQVCTATYYYYNNAQWPKISVLKKLEKFKVNLTTWHIGKNCILWIQGMLPFFLIPLLKNWLVKNWTIPEKSVFKDNSHLVYFSFFGMVFQLLLRSLFERPLLGPNCYSIFIWTCLYSENFCQKFRVGIKSFFLIDMQIYFQLKSFPIFHSQQKPLPF